MSRQNFVSGPHEQRVNNPEVARRSARPEFQNHPGLSLITLQYSARTPGFLPQRNSSSLGVKTLISAESLERMNWTHVVPQILLRWKEPGERAMHEGRGLGTLKTRNFPP